MATIGVIDGAKVQELMTRRILSTAALSRNSGVSYSTIADILHGRRASVRNTTLAAIAKCLDVEDVSIMA